MAQVKTIRHGRIRIKSGDSVPLEKVVPFVDGGLSYTENFPTNEIRDRQELTDELTAGEEQPVEWSFTAQFVDKTVMRTIRDKVWDGIAETIAGLTGGAVNLNAPLTYAYEQGSLEFASGEVGTKLPVPGTAPTSDDEFSEEPGTEDVEEVLRVPKGDGTVGSGGFNVQQPAADVDRDVVYDAVGKGTLGNDDCSGGRKTFQLVLEEFDPCDPPKASDLTAGTKVEDYVLNHAYVTQVVFQEGESATTFQFTGRALIGRVKVVSYT